MEHVDGASRRQTDRNVRRRTAGSRREHARAARWVVAGVGLVLSAAVGVTTVAIALAEAGDRTTGVPAGHTAAVDTGPATLAPWGLRLTPQGLLAPDDATARTPLEELYAELLRPPAP